MSETWRVADAKDVLLGLARIPDSAAEQLRSRGFAACADIKPAMVVGWGAEPSQIGGIVSSFHLKQSFYRDDALELVDILPEQLEEKRGFFFYPGAGYIKSLIKGQSE